MQRWFSSYKRNCFSRDISDSLEGIRGRVEAKWWHKNRKRKWEGTTGRPPRRGHFTSSEKKWQLQMCSSAVVGKEYLLLGAIHVEEL